MRGLLTHLLLTLRLNFRSKMPIIYGYLVPIFFLIGFAAVFRTAHPPLLHELGQLLTITILGGACFGMPTAMVAERERGIWRRFKLLPLSTGSLVFSTMVARLVLVASAAAMQILLAIFIYKMPAPQHPGQLAAAFLFVTFAFLGMGLVIAMLAETVPAVQALGQAIFLPMILIGGVGVPLSALPDWAGIVAGYLPGRYAVAALDSCIFGDGLFSTKFSLIALLVIGCAACLAGANLFRWDAGQQIAAKQRGWIIVALAAWAAVGVTAQLTHQSPIEVAGISALDYQSITDAQIQSITYDELQDDSGMVTPLIQSPEDVSPAVRKWMADFQAQLSTWPPGNIADPVRRTRNLISLAAAADLDRFQYEGEVPYVVFQQLQAQILRPRLEKILAWIILRPGDGTVLLSAPEFGIAGDASESDVRDRTTQYAKKLLGRLLGKLG